MSYFDLYFPSADVRAAMRHSEHQTPRASAHPSAGLLASAGPLSRQNGGSEPADALLSSSSEAIGQPTLLPGTGPGGSIAAVLQKRLQHIAKGFTPESDDARSLKELTTKLRFYADDARAFAFNPRVDGDHAAMRDKLVEVGALALALIDRLDRAAASKGTPA